MKKPAILGLGVILAAAIVAAVIGGMPETTSSEAFTERVNECYAKKGDAVKISCFSALFASEIGIRDGKEVMNDLTSLDGRLCHPPTHVLGQEIMKKYRSVEIALEHCSQQCSSGCLHGIVGQALIDVPDINVSLEELQHPSLELINEFGAQFCAAGSEACHGVGHILFQLYADFDTALSICEKIGPRKIDVIGCERGVFMENNLAFSTQNIVQGESRRVFRDVDNMLFPCDSVASRFRAVCYHFLHHEQEWIFGQKGITDEAEKSRLRFEACETISARNEYLACIEGSAYAASPNVDCAPFPDAEARAMCVYGAVKFRSAFDMYDEAVNFCATQKEPLSIRACYQSYFLSLESRKVRALEDGCPSNDEQCTHELNKYITRSETDLYLKFTGQ